jgi:LacI family transcriptional regulator
VQTDLRRWREAAVKVDISAVAAAAGVSRTTVSHALSGKRYVAAETKERILAAIEELGYRPNRVAQSLRRRSTLSVAYLATDLSNPYYPAVIKALHRGLDAVGYALLIGETDGSAGGERHLLEEMVARQVDAVVIHPMAMSVPDIRELVGGLPLVAAVGDPDAAVDVPADVIMSDDALGIGEALRHLIDRGYRDIAFLSGPSDVKVALSRLGAFREASAAAGHHVPEDWIDHVPFTRDGGAEAMRRLLKCNSRPRAVMCANDLIAIGALDVLREAGLRVPEDVAVVGFDDIDLAELLTPRLTTVKNPAAAVGAACAEAVLARLAGPRTEAAFTFTTLPTTLQIRDST